jgi:hypothetical protein
MTDKFLQQTGVEVGYFDKRKKQFNREIAKGLAVKKPQVRKFVMRKGAKPNAK